MSIEVTMDWRETRLAKTNKGWTASDVYDVFGTTGMVNAMYAKGVPRINSGHRRHNRLFCRNVSIQSRPRPDFWKIRVDYATPEGGGTRHEDTETDPLNEPPMINWLMDMEQINIDQDIDGNPILNSAFGPFRSDPTADGGPVGLEITRNEPFFNPGLAYRMRNKINTDQFKVGNVVMFQPLEGRVLSISTTAPYSLDDEYVNVRYLFQLREKRDIKNGPTVSGHQLRLLDQGTSINVDRVYSENGDGEVVLEGRVALLDAKLNPIREPQLLNGKGGLYGTNVGAGTPPGAIVEDTGSAVWLHYRRYQSSPYAKEFSF